jgi:hypothetical protein
MTGQPPPCILCPGEAVAHCRVGRLERAKYINIKTTGNWTMYNKYAVCGDCLCGVDRDAKISVDLDKDNMPNQRLSDKRLKEMHKAKYDSLVNEAVTRKCLREGNAWIWGHSVASVWLSTRIHHLGNNVHIPHVHSGNNPQDVGDIVDAVNTGCERRAGETSPQDDGDDYMDL